MSLLDIALAEKHGNTINSQIKNLILNHGSLERNIGLHIKLMNEIPRFHNASGHAFNLLIKKIEQIENRIDQYMEYMLELDLAIPDRAIRLIRLKDLKRIFSEKNNESNDNIISMLEKENEALNNTIYIAHNKIKKLSLRTKFKLSNLNNEEIESMVDKNRKKNGDINFAAVGRNFGLDPKTVKSEVDRRKLHYLYKSPM